VLLTYPEIQDNAQSYALPKIVSGSKALTGYKDGSYGGAMKGVMKGQVAKLTDDDIKAIAEAVGKKADDKKAEDKKAEDKKEDNATK